MAKRYPYAKEILSKTVLILATHQGDARKRVAAAYGEFFPLTEEHFPPKYRSDWKWITEAITKFGPVYDYKGDVQEGSVEHTMSRVKNSTAAKVATRLFYLHSKAEGAYPDSNSDWKD